jgi:hypothetical protein
MRNGSLPPFLSAGVGLNQLNKSKLGSNWNPVALWANVAEGRLCNLSSARRQPRTRSGAKREARATKFAQRATGFLQLLILPDGYLMWTPEMAREMTRRWISEVPSKIV